MVPALPDANSGLNEPPPPATLPGTDVGVLDKPDPPGLWEDSTPTLLVPGVPVARCRIKVVNCSRVMTPLVLPIPWVTRSKIRRILGAISPRFKTSLPCASMLNMVLGSRTTDGLFTLAVRPPPPPADPPEALRVPPRSRPCVTPSRAASSTHSTPRITSSFTCTDESTLY
jgi:hypothetical protein